MQLLDAEVGSGRFDLYETMHTSIVPDQKAIENTGVLAEVMRWINTRFLRRRGVV